MSRGEEGSVRTRLRIGKSVSEPPDPTPRSRIGKWESEAVDPAVTRLDATPLADVVCTEKLDRRAWRRPDYKHENQALSKLARVLSDAPTSILQALADTILEVTQSDSAGLSFLTVIQGEERFYWPAIAGMWRPHVGGGTPRDFGPCGDVLDRSAPLLFCYPERRYAYRSEERRVGKECRSRWSSYH